MKTTTRDECDEAEEKRIVIIRHFRPKLGPDASGAKRRAYGSGRIANSGSDPWVDT